MARVIVGVIVALVAAFAMLSGLLDIVAYGADSNSVALGLGYGLLLLIALQAILRRRWAELALAAVLLAGAVAALAGGYRFPLLDKSALVSELALPSLLAAMSLVLLYRHMGLSRHHA